MRRTCVLLFICTLLTEPVWGQRIVEIEEGMFASSPDTISRELGGGREISIRSAENLTGRISIKTGSGDSVTVTFTRQARTESRSRAFDYIDLMSMEINISPKGALIGLLAPNNPTPWDEETESGSIIAEITVPEGCQIEIDASLYDVQADGPFESFRVPSSLGRYAVSQVTNDLQIETVNRRVDLIDIAGNISVSTSNARLTAHNIRATEVQADFRNEGGDIVIDDMIGSVRIRNSFGRIDLSDFDPGEGISDIRGTSAPVVVDFSTLNDGQIRLRSRGEDIDITIPSDLSAALMLSVDEGGSIEANGFTFETELILENRLSLLVGDAIADLNASIQGPGNIFIRGINTEN